MNTVESTTAIQVASQAPLHVNAQAVERLIDGTRAVLTAMNKTSAVTVLEREAQAALNSSYRLAVIGEFKSGKSTLINAAFLGSEVLFADPLEATCVATELSYGEQPTMKIFPYSDKLESLPNGDGDITVRDKEAQPVIVAMPTSKDIRVETTADTPEDREFKARRISRVCVELPRSTLKGQNVIDSPGINSTNQAVADAALRIIPSCDTVIFVTRGGQLTQAEEEFLGSGVFARGITRGLVVINHFDNLTPLNSEGRRQHVEALRSKLRQLDKGHLEVTVVDARSWLDALKAGDPIPKDASAFSSTLDEFLHRELGQARLEKLVQVCRKEIRAAQVELTTTHALNTKKRAELEKYTAQLESREKDATVRIDNLLDCFEDGLNQHLRQFRSSLRVGINQTIDRFKASLRVAPDLGALSEQVSSMQRMIQPQLEANYFESVRHLKRDLASSQERFIGELRRILNQLDDGILRNPADGINLPPIAAPIVTIVDYILVVIISPLPLVADVILRLLADRFPEIRKVMPSGLVKSMAVTWIEKNLDRQTGTALDEIDRRVDEIQAQAVLAVGRSTRELLAEETAPIRKAIAAIEARQTPWSTEEVDRFQGRLGSLETELRKYIS